MSAEQDEPVGQDSGWGWGWLSDAAKAAKSAYDANVKPALESMEKTTSQFGTNLFLCVVSKQCSKQGHFKQNLWAT